MPAIIEVQVTLACGVRKMARINIMDLQVYGIAPGPGDGIGADHIRANPHFVPDKDPPTDCRDSWS